jgi:NAD(P)H-flavin reductase
MSQHAYLPDLARIQRVVDETSDVKTFELAFLDAERAEGFTYRPGQFVEVSVFGVGEAPFGLSSTPTRPGSIMVTVRAVGTVTRALHALGPGDLVGVRGPLGNDFLSVLNGGQGSPAPLPKRPLIVGGGIGLPPLRSLINYMLDRPQEFPELTILYGARTPADRVYKAELAEWAQRDNVQFLETVDVGDAEWKGRVGLVTELFQEVEFDPQQTVAFVCGPPIMIHFVILELLERKVPPECIISTLERHMKCGIGKCGHCAIGHKYVCTDGPVFTYAAMQELHWQSGEQP